MFNCLKKNFNPFACICPKDSITIDPTLKAETFEKPLDIDSYDFVCPSVSKTEDSYKEFLEADSYSQNMPSAFEYDDL